MGAYKDKDKNMEGLMWLSGLSTNETALKTYENNKNSLTCICSQSLQFTRLDLRLPGELGEICLISETQQQPWGQKEGQVIPLALILRQFCIQLPDGSTQGTPKTVLILTTCPEDNFTLEPEGVDIPPVDLAQHPPQLRK